MNPVERSFHDSFKPRWAPDGACIYSTPEPHADLLGSIPDGNGSTLSRVNVFTKRDLATEVYGACFPGVFVL